MTATNKGAVAPTHDVVTINGYKVGRTSPKSRIFLIWDADEDKLVGKFGLMTNKATGIQEVLSYDFGIGDDDIQDIAAEYYDQRDAKRAAAAKAKKAAKGATKPTARRPRVTKDEATHAVA